MFSPTVSMPIYDCDSIYPTPSIHIGNILNGRRNPNACNCCPYGYHIDLDFVKFAEDISTGKEQIQNWSIEPNAKRTRVTSPNLSFTSPDGAKSPFRPNFPPITSANSCLVESTNSAFVPRSRDIKKNQNYYKDRTIQQNFQPLNFFPPSILKNRHVADNVILSPKHSSVRFTNVQPNYHQSRVHQFENQTPGRSSGTSVSDYRSHLGGSAPAPFSRFSLNVASRKAWTDSQKAAPLFDGPRQTTDGSVEPFRQNERIFSAPTSPVPKTFHTAIAQSMAQLKNIGTNNTPSQNFHNDRSDYFSDYAKNNIGNYAQSEVSVWPAQAGIRQSRILSPEPDTTHATGGMASPMALRTYNWQSRSYFHNNNNSNNNVYHNDCNDDTTTPHFAGNSNNIPLFSHAEKLPRSVAVSSPLFNIEAFASVRRPKIQSQNQNINVIKAMGNSNDKVDVLRPQPQNQSAIVSKGRGDGNVNVNVRPSKSSIGIQSKTIKKDTSTITEVQQSECRPTVEVGVNTSDVSITSKKLFQPKLRLEFQFCIGHEPEYTFDEIVAKRNVTDKSIGTTQVKTSTQKQQTDSPRFTNQLTNTEDNLTPKTATKSRGTDAPSDLIRRACVGIQTTVDVENSSAQTDTNPAIFSVSSGMQTDEATESQWIKQIFAEKFFSKLSPETSADQKTAETENDDVLASEFILVTCSKCENSSLESSSTMGAGEIYEKILDTASEASVEEVFTEKMSPIVESVTVGLTAIEKAKITTSAITKATKNERRYSAPTIPTIEILAEENSRSDFSSVLITVNENENWSKLIRQKPITTNITSMSKSANSVNSLPLHDFVASNYDNNQNVNINAAITEICHIDETTEKQSLECLHADHRLDTLTASSDERDVELDRISIDTDVQTVVSTGYEKRASRSSSSVSIFSDNTIIDLDPRLLDPSSTEAIRKLLTEPQGSSTYAGKSGESTAFRRDASSNRSYRIERSKSSDLDYIADKHIAKSESCAGPSTPSSLAGLTQDTGLKQMVVLKKTPTVPEESEAPIFPVAIVGVRPPSSSTSYNVAAKIPRPKYFTKYSMPPASSQMPETPDEEAEAADHLPPLRSEMRSLSAWGNSSHYIAPYKSVHMRNERYNLSPSDYSDDEQIVFQEQDLFDEEEEDEADVSGRLPECSSSADDEAQSDATYEMSESESGETNAIYFENDAEVGAVKLSVTLLDALVAFSATIGSETAAITIASLSATNDSEWAMKFVRHEWLKLSTKRLANARLIDAFLRYISDQFSVNLMRYIVNLTDQNDNTALHYAVSHENYDIVSVLLDSKACNVDAMNKAGYSAIMLGALCDIHNGTESAIIHRLFHVGNINAKAIKHSQTALMLAASHGRVETTELLLNCGADVNLQDVDGSTALMCAAEHGQKEIVKILLKQPNIDASLTDCDNQTALSIAVENQHRDIGVIIYAHLNFSRLEQNDNLVMI